MAGCAAIDDNDYYINRCSQIVEIREYSKKRLSQLGFEYLDSDSNFIFARSDKIGGEDYYKKLKENGVLVRHFSDEKINDFVRITVGTKEQMDTLFCVTEKILKEV